MVRLRIEYFVSEDVDEVAQCPLNTHHCLVRHGDINHLHSSHDRQVVVRSGRAKLLEAAEQVGVWLNDVQMGVLRLGVVGIELRETHVGYLAPLPCASLDVSVVLAVEGVFLYAVKQFQGIVERLMVARSTCIFRQTINGEANGIKLLLRVERAPLAVDAPEHPTMLLVVEMVDEVSLCPVGSLQVLRLAQHTVSRGEGPQDASVEYRPLLRVGMQHPHAVHAPVKASVRLIHHVAEPEVEDVVFQDIPHFLPHFVHYSIHTPIS